MCTPNPVSNCEVADTDDIVQNFSNISFYIGKVAFEKNCSVPAYLKSTDIKTSEGFIVHNIEHLPQTPGGLIGAISRDVVKITNTIGSITDSFDLNPAFSCVKCGDDIGFVYENQFQNLGGTNKTGCSKIQNWDDNYSDCKILPTEGFANKKKIKKELFNLYLLGFGTLIVFLSYKLLMKK